MIIDLPDTTTQALNDRLVSLRDSGGVVALGRVMTLVIVADEACAERAVRAANDASREHPCRILTVVRRDGCSAGCPPGPGDGGGTARMDAQIRVGGDAGASEVLVLRLRGALAGHADSVVVPLLLPDAPTVAWWPGQAPAAPQDDPIGRMAQRRITDAARCNEPIASIVQRADGHAPGDTDLSWSRTTRWRGLLASALDQPPFEPVVSAHVTGAADSPSAPLMAGWLSMRLGCEAHWHRTAPGTGLTGVRLARPSGDVLLERPDGVTAVLRQPGRPVRSVAMPRRSDSECLAEELRRLDPDEVFAEVLARGLPLLPALTDLSDVPGPCRQAVPGTAAGTAPDGPGGGEGR